MQVLKRLMLAAGLTLVAGCAQNPPPPTVAVAPVRKHYGVQPNHVIQCTTTDVFLFTTSDCGQGFDPLGIAGR